MCQQISKDDPAVSASSRFPSRAWVDTLVPSLGESLQHSFNLQTFARHISENPCSAPLLSTDCPRVPLAKLPPSGKKGLEMREEDPLHQSPMYFCGAHANHLLPSPLTTECALFVPNGKCTDAAHF